jgi:hypothetical protein
MPTYVSAPDAVTGVVWTAIKNWHHELTEAGVRVAVLLAYGRRDEETNEITSPAISHGGYPALGLCRINGLRDRVEGKADATLIFDGDQWPGLSDARQLSLADHECQHLELVRDDEGNVKLDDACRPRLKIRKHDLVVGGFTKIVERHGGEANEAVALVQCQQMLQPLFAEWG